LRTITDGNGVIRTGGGEGLCLYESPVTSKLSAFVITRAGEVGQYVISDRDGDRRLEGRLRRQFTVGSEAEGCVADDRTGALYIAEEDVALWRYQAEPTAGNRRIAVDRAGARGNLAPDIEGLTLVHQGAAGYLIASAQNAAAPSRSYFAVYTRTSNALVKTFRITSGARADGCERTDGITAYAGNLGRSFPAGLFVCQDNSNTRPGSRGNQNFKLTRLERILNLRA
jgi:3-phytase